MPTAGFEPTVSAGERQQTDVLDRAATGTGEDIAYLLTYLLTYSMEHSPSSEANWFCS